MSSYIYGALRKNSIGRWEVDDREFSSGSFLEISIEENWIGGFIEHGSGGYYFHTENEGIVISLFEGMDVRCH